MRLKELTGTGTRSTTSALRVHLLGWPAVVLGIGRTVALARKDAALLAVLAIDGPMPRSRVAALLWPEADPPAAHNSLRQRLFRLRRAAGSDLVEQQAIHLRLAARVHPDLTAPLPSLTGNTPASRELLGAFDYEDCQELNEWVHSARHALRLVIGA